MNGAAAPPGKKRMSKRQRMRLKVTGTDGSAKRMPVVKQVGVFVLFIWVVIPIFVFALAWIFGGILARVEGWPAMWSFYYCISKLCGLTNPLVDDFPATSEIVDVAISLWGMALNGVIAGVIGTLTLLVNLVQIAETAKLKRIQEDDMNKAVDELKDDAKLDFDAFYEAMEEHVHTERDEALDIFKKADVDNSGFLTKAEAVAMMKHWKAPSDLEELSPEELARHRAKAAALIAVQRRVSGTIVMAPTPPPAEPAAEESEESWWRVLLVFIIFVFMVVPGILCIASLIFGALLADAEGWPWQDGFLYVITNLCILGGELTAASPTTDRGRAVDVIIGLWSLSVQGTVIGIVGTLSIHERLVKSMEGVEFKPLFCGCLGGNDDGGYDDDASVSVKNNGAAPAEAYAGGPKRSSKLQFLEMEMSQ